MQHKRACSGIPYPHNGHEYEELVEMIYSHKADFVQVTCGKPLVTSHQDTEAVVKALMGEDYGLSGNYVAGANIAGFRRVVKVMRSQGYV